MITRRGLFLGAASLLAAPSIVRAASLMPVRAATGPYLISPNPIWYRVSPYPFDSYADLIAEVERVLRDKRSIHIHYGCRI